MSCPGLAYAAFFTMSNRPKHELYGYIHIFSFLLNDTIIVSYVKEKKSLNFKGSFYPLFLIGAATSAFSAEFLNQNEHNNNNDRYP